MRQPIDGDEVLNALKVSVTCHDSPLAIESKSRCIAIAKGNWQHSLDAGCSNRHSSIGIDKLQRKISDQVEDGCEGIWAAAPISDVQCLAKVYNGHCQAAKPSLSFLEELRDPRRARLMLNIGGKGKAIQHVMVSHAATAAGPFLRVPILPCAIPGVHPSVALLRAITRALAGWGFPGGERPR